MVDSLRDLQIANIKRMLSLHTEQSAATLEHTVWKVLVFDKLGQDIISSVLRVNDLRESGVTVHMQLKTDRQPIADVPVVYFVQPTTENVQRITEDLGKTLYDTAYLNFSSSIPRSLLEDLAASTSANGSAGNIVQVYDQYLNFIVTEPDLFSLGLPDVFRTLNAPSITEAAVESAIDSMVTGLFSVIVTLDNIPIIRCPGGNAAEMVARKLDQRLRDHVLNNRQNYTPNHTTQYQRPVLVILDRTVDLVSMVSHSWTYQALVHDLCDLHLNRITLTADNEKRKAYDLDTHDFFWANNANTVFPSVAENIQVELDKFTKEKAEITRKTGITDIDELDPSKAGTTIHLHAALKALPEMQARKSTLDMHMTIATAVLKGVQERHIDKFVESEETISRMPKAQLLAALRDSERKPEDKVRLFLIYYLSVEEIKKADMQEYEATLVEAGCDMTPLKAIKKVRELTRMSVVTAPVLVQNQNSAQDQLFRGFSSLKNTLGARMQEAGISENFNTLISGVKNFLPSSSNLTVTRIIESLMDPQASQSYTSSTSLTDDYLYFDPRTRNAQKPARGQSFGEAVVFMVGGGNYVEYGNLLDWCDRQKAAGRDKRVIYGASEIVSPTAFVSELSRSL